MNKPEAIKRLSGRMIEIDGADASGKETQVERLVKKLRDFELDVLKLHFPRYGEPSARNVERYLGGEFGPAESLDSRKVSKWYAEDRLAAAPEIREALGAGQVVVCDRFVCANMGHQGAKLDSFDSRVGFFRWDEAYEYGELGLPRPDLTILLAVPYEVVIERLLARTEESDLKPDEHEKNHDHIRRAIETYHLMSAVLGVPLIECGKWSRDEVERIIWMVIEREL